MYLILTYMLYYPQADLEHWLTKRPDVSKLHTIRKTLKKLKLKFKHKQVDREDLEEVSWYISKLTGDGAKYRKKENFLCKIVGWAFFEVFILYFSSQCW